MKQKLFLAICLSISALGFSQETFDGIPTGEGYYINKIIAGPPGNDQTREYFELRGPANTRVPDNLYLAAVEGDGESGSRGRVTETIRLQAQAVDTALEATMFGANGTLVVISNYMQGDVFTESIYTNVISADSFVLTTTITGSDINSGSNDAFISASPDLGYDGDFLNPTATFMLISADEDPDNDDIDDVNNDDITIEIPDGIIDATGDYVSNNWVLFDSVAYTDDDGHGASGEFAYGQMIFAQELSTASADIFTTTSAEVIEYVEGGSDANFLFRQGLKTGYTTNDWGIANISSEASAPLYSISSNVDRTNREFFTRLGIGDVSDGDAFLYGEINPVEANAWNGSASADWAEMTNWDLGIVPVEGGVITIGATGNDPVISSTTGAEAFSVAVDAAASLTIESGGSLILGDSATGDITYNVSVADTNFHLIASPVSNETYNDTWVTDNEVASGTAANLGIGVYSNASFTDTWSYFQGGTEENFDNGTGYALKRTVAGDYSFTGGYPSIPASLDIAQGASNWNLTGNVAPAYLDIASLIAGNVANITSEFQAVYVFDGAIYSPLTAGQLTPGQAFFINAGVASGSLDITAEMLGDNSSLAARSSEVVINLNVSNGSVSESTKLSFDENASLGLDPGQDLGKFNGVASGFNLYTELVANNEGVAFGKQTLPNVENTAIPVGLVASSGEEVTFSVDLQNESEDVVLYLEDTVNGVFVNILEDEYKTTLTEDANGIGQFYLHTTAAKTLSNEDIINNIDGINVYVSSNDTLVVTGLNGEGARVSVYSVLGAQVVSQILESDSIVLPSLNAGVYIVNVKTDSGEVSKKIILD